MTQSWVFKDEKFAGQLKREKTFQTDGRRYADDLRRCPCSQESANQSPQWERRINRESGGREKYWRWGAVGGGWCGVGSWRPERGSRLGNSRSQRSE